MLHGLGLDNAGGIVYLAMLTGPATDIGGLAGRTGLPEDHVGLALEALAGLGLARVSDVSPGQWEPVGPGPGLAAVLRSRVLAPPWEQITATNATFGAAAAGTTSSPLEPIADLEAVRVQAQHLARAATSDLRVTLAAPQVPGDWPSSGILDDASPAAGVRLSVLCHDRARDDRTVMAYIGRLQEAGARVRVTPDLPPVLMICDQQAALVPRQATDPARGAVCTREPAIVATLCGMFATAWNAATPLMSTIPPARNGTAAELATSERALLRLLVTGLTDEAAARQLGISVRTARRRMATLMRKLGASSRFQAGHKAAERGWLSDAGPNG